MNPLQSPPPEETPPGGASRGRDSSPRLEGGRNSGAPGPALGSGTPHSRFLPGKATPPDPRCPRSPLQRAASPQETHREPVTATLPGTQRHTPFPPWKPGTRHRRPHPAPEHLPGPAPLASSAAEAGSSPGLTESLAGAEAWVVRRSRRQHERNQAGQKEETLPHVPGPAAGFTTLGRRSTTLGRLGLTGARKTAHIGEGIHPARPLRPPSPPAPPTGRTLEPGARPPEVQAALRAPALPASGSRRPPHRPQPEAGAARHAGRPGSPRPAPRGLVGLLPRRPPSFSARGLCSASGPSSTGACLASARDALTRPSTVSERPRRRKAEVREHALRRVRTPPSPCCPRAVRTPVSPSVKGAVKSIRGRQDAAGWTPQALRACSGGRRRHEASRSAPRDQGRAWH